MKENSSISLYLLKSLSMLFIIVHHLLNHGGLLKNLTSSNPTFVLWWVLNIIALYAVNIFASISGYVIYGKKIKRMAIIKLWLVVEFYNVVLRLVFYYMFGVSSTLIQYLFPFFTREHWYFNAYIPLYFLIPYINSGLEHMKKKDVNTLGLTLFALFSVLPTFSASPILGAGSNSGYNTYWLIIMFVFGHIIRRNIETLNRKKTQIGVVLFFCLVIQLLWKVSCVYLHKTGSLNFLDSNLLLNYISPFNVVASLSILTLFSTTKINLLRYKRLILLVANSAFSVYIIHDKKIVRGEFITGKTASFPSESSSFPVLRLVLFSVGIYVICLIIDVVRISLFNLIGKTFQKYIKGNWKQIEN